MLEAKLLFKSNIDGEKNKFQYLAYKASPAGSLGLYFRGGLSDEVFNFRG
jgi:hypothetical protein